MPKFVQNQVMPADSTSLTTVNGPWVHLFRGEPGKAYELSWRLNHDGSVSRVLRGMKMRDLQGMFDEVGAALQFPNYFGENWPALHECLTDLEWLQGDAYVLVVTHAGKVLDKAGEAAFGSLFKTAELAHNAWATANAPGSTWSHPAVPFHMVLQEERATAPLLSDRLHAAGVTFTEM
jgi:hypothetical protein